MRLSALACISISLAALDARAGEAPPDPARVAVLEMEAGLAKKPGVYLVLDPQRRILEVRSRGAVLDAVALKGVEVVSQQPVLRRDVPSHPPIPAVWTVEQGAGDSDREVLEPTELRPAPKMGEDEDEPEPTPSATPAPPTPTPTPTPLPPVSYRNRLTNGWDLWITDALPPQSNLLTFVAAVKDGWRRLRGLGEDHIPAITLAMGDDDARRIHHLLRTGMPILVAGEM
ncbi:MAG TPA: hypothetical protein VMT19_08170 [Thermoanaerobaculaceae bacterium]|nr:hypothetical protein [Thermoanaerobaculaceae bacterium]